MSHWVHSAQSSEQLPGDAARAVAAARTPPGQVATLILPANVSWDDCPPGPAGAEELAAPRRVRDEVVEKCADALGCGEPTMIVLGGHVGDRELELAARIATATGARLALETFPTRVPWGAGHATCDKIPYLPELAIEHLKTVRRMILVGARPPASFFAYPNLPSVLTHEECELITLAGPHHDRSDALERLAEAAHALEAEPARNPLAPPALPGAVALSTGAVGDVIAALLPEGAIVVDEGATCGMEVFGRTRTALAHEWLVLTGGSIGWGLPAATGAAIAAPARKVVCLEGDGCAMYTIQALWTMAREQLDVTVVLFANRDYAILQLEYMRVGATGMGANARSMMHIGNPDIDFVSLARSMGVHATRASDAAEFAEQFADAMATRGPRLIETMMPGLGL
jgi:acetolactate synthase-1/2/3 large subunit